MSSVSFSDRTAMQDELRAMKTRFGSYQNVDSLEKGLEFLNTDTFSKGSRVPISLFEAL